MKRRGLRMFAVAALVPMMAIAQAPNRAPGDEDPAAAQVTQLVRDLVANISKHDPKVPREFFADEAIITGFWGDVSGKADLIRTVEGIHGRSNPENSHEVNDFTVHTYGDEIAIVNCLVVFHTVAHSIQGNTPARQDDRTTITFFKREGRWRAVAVQYTDVPHSQSTIQNFVPQLKA
ncbi:MAG TPA: nuclear transport factor 2 family protein, partial [Candidatus Angelobacter sp.]